jgi:CDP-diglyceride synthetase
METFGLDSFFGGAPGPAILRKLPCKTPMLTFLLSAIFILNIFVIVYTMYTEYGKKSDVNDIRFNIHIPTLIYYIIILGVTIKFHCSPMTSLLFHPVLFVVVFCYLLVIGLTGLSNLYFLSQIDESNKLQNLFTKAMNMVKGTIETNIAASAAASGVAPVSGIPSAAAAVAAASEGFMSY